LLLSGLFCLICAGIVAGCGGDAQPESPLSLTDLPGPLPHRAPLVDLAQGPPPEGRWCPDPQTVEISGNFREAAWPLHEVPRQRLTFDTDGSLELSEGEHFSWPDLPSDGLHVWIKPTGSALSHTETYPIEYRFIPRADFAQGRGRVAVFNGAPPAPDAIVRLRPLPPADRTWRSTPTVVPPDGRLMAAYGVARDWPLESSARFEFTLRVVPEGAEADAMQVVKTLDATTDAAEDWQEVALDLSGLAGQTVTVHCEAKALDGAARRDSVQPFWSVPQLTGTPEREERRPNILLIVLDTLRVDRLHHTGYGRETSPELDRFAQESTVFLNAVSPSTWTTPSHASMFTGAQVWQHGAGSWFRGFSLSDRWNTIAEIARAEGYTTAAFTEGGAVGGRFGFSQGFEQYDDGPVFEGPRSGTAKITLEKAWDWMARRAAAPFFMFVHTFEIHAPYCSPPPDGTAYVNPEAGSCCIDEDEITDDEIGARASSLYDGGVRYTDRMLGAFLERMKTEGLLENTIVVITSDHGEEFGEHGAYGHSTHIFPEVCNVPLMVRMPGPARPGTKVDTLVGTIDLHATLAEFMGAPADRVFPEARSFAALARGDADATYDRPYVFCHLPQRDQDAALATGRDHEYEYYSIRSQEARFMITNHFWMLREIGAMPPETAAAEWTEFAFEHLADPFETQNLAESPSEELKRLRGILYDRLRADGQLRHSLGNSESRALDVSEESIQQMEAMGYF
jgi:arylsulfatase A-like enzyme